MPLPHIHIRPPFGLKGKGSRSCFESVLFELTCALLEASTRYPRVSIRVVNVRISGGYVSVRCWDTRNEGEGRNSKITWINPRIQHKLHMHTHTHTGQLGLGFGHGSVFEFGLGPW